MPLLALALLVGATPRTGSMATAGSGSTHTLGLRGYEPGAHGNSKNVVYHGGPVMVGTSVDYAIFWQPIGSKISKTFNSLIERYFGDIGNSPLYFNNSQYTDSHGGQPLASSFGGAWVDTQAYPSEYITDAQLQQEVTHGMQVNGWTASLDHVFFVYTARGAHICFTKNHNTCSPNAFCAYHSAFGNNVIYAAMPDVLCGTPSSPNHNREADNVIDSSSHEQMEAATDPLGNAWYHKRS